jgi:hypothetical protein
VKILIFILLAATVLFGFYGLSLLFGGSALLVVVPALALLCGLLGWFLPSALKQVNPNVWIVSGLILLIGLLVPSSSLMADREPGPVSTLIETTLLLLPPLALVNAAILFHSSLEKSSALSLALSILILFRTIYNLYNLTLWDNTDDPLGYIWLILPILATLLSGVMLSVALPGRLKLAGPVYIILVSVLLIAVSASAQRVDFRQETAGRAERTVHAIESYYARKGSYPKTLSQLTPWYILSLPKPMVIYGQDWCYESGGDFYRLGYLDREHWSDPRLIGRIHKSVGETIDSQLICMEEFTTLRNLRPDYPFFYWKESE